ncbi:GNAT family N-acetyltransferase [Dactylosporangium matsuzakiense]|uniref:N-acetyltransferase n=1 Tax=Dactylosporangium matsuzakiense TaxID=53360 RepID=A0A9W6KJU1_9ACTN|nr:GNAT family N-acetyltransferase [Dactylosporangium matsuzakiense]UWZ46840.1 N-acetyltransferase [Dactylosporangium matsuzakiense]GLL01819.1 N-acetyltransferase [Dactylosporangium matsuzakiense]
MDFQVIDNPDRHRFEIRVDGELAGGAYYTATDDEIVFTHTEVEPQFEGQGVGSKLANGALTLANDAGKRIVPQCPFIAAYLKKHPELASAA